MFDAAQPPTPKPQSKGFFLSEAESSIEEEAPNDYSSTFYNKERKEILGDELILKVTIKSCDNLIPADWNGFSDAYVECRLFSSVPIAINKVTKSSTQLLPEETVAISSNLAAIQTQNSPSSSPPLNEKPNNSPTTTRSFFSKKKSTSQTNVSHGNLSKEYTKTLPSVESVLSLSHKESPNINEQIASEMQSDEVLPVKWNQIGRFTKTTIIFKNLNPKWGESGEDLTFFIDKREYEQILAQRQDSNRIRLFIRMDVFDYDKYTRDDVLGHCIIDLESEDIYSLVNSTSPKSITKSLAGVKHGSINFDISLIEDTTIFNAQLVHILQRRREEGNLIPKSIDILFDYVLENCCEIEGVLRIPGSRAHILRLKKKMDEMIELPPSGKTFLEVFVPEETNNEFPHTAVGVLKEFLRVMPTPIIQFELYDDCISLVESKEEGLEKLEEILKRVERAHIPLFHKTVKFMKQIANHSSLNRMTPKNIGIVMGPNILRRRGQTADSALRHVNHISGFVELLINSYEFIMKVLDKIMFEGLDQAGKFEKLMGSLDIVTVEEEEDLQSDSSNDDNDNNNTTTITTLDVNEEQQQQQPSNNLRPEKSECGDGPIDSAVVDSTPLN